MRCGGRAWRLAALLLLVPALGGRGKPNVEHTLQTILEATNQFRAGEGHKPFKLNPHLSAAAQQHAAHMAQAEMMSHAGFAACIRQAGYR